MSQTNISDAEKKELYDAEGKVSCASPVYDNSRITNREYMLLCSLFDKKEGLLVVGWGCNCRHLTATRQAGHRVCAVRDDSCTNARFGEACTTTL